MNHFIDWGGLLIFIYIVGSIPFGVLITKYILGYNLQSKGSGNIGMTNVIRTSGKLPGLFTFLGDFGKGCLAVWIGQRFLFNLSIYWVVVIPFLVVFAHTHSIFLKFTGGKGVATNFGCWLILDWRIFLVIISTWILMFLWKKISSLSAIISLIVLPLVTYFLHGLDVLFILSLFNMIYIISLHRSNIRRLLQRQEGVLKTEL